MKNLYGDDIIEEEVDEEFKIEKKSSYFFFKSINTHDDVMKDNPDLEKEYIPFVMNRYLSFHYDAISDANDMNIHSHLGKRLQFDYFINSLRKMKRQPIWEKFSSESDLKLVKEYFNYSLSKSKDALKLLSKDDLMVISKRLYKGGLKK